MPLSVRILNIYGYEITNISGRNPVIIEARYTGEISCPFCGRMKLRKKDKYIRKLNHESIGQRLVKLYLTGYKYHCQACGRYFNMRFPGVLKYKRSSEAFRSEVFEKHSNGHTQSYGDRRALLYQKKGYATTICDLSKRKVFDIVLGRSEKALDSYFRHLKGKDNVSLSCDNGPIGDIQKYSKKTLSWSHDSIRQVSCNKTHKLSLS